MSVSSLTSVCLAVVLSVLAGAPVAAEPESEERVILRRLDEPFIGDLPQMKAERVIRILVTHSRTNFFFDNGAPRGFEYEMLSRYGNHLNRGVERPDRRVKIAFVPVPFDRLLPALREGRGDIAAAGLTVTPSRSRLVAFTRPYIPSVSEVVVAHRSAAGLRSLDDLAGRTAYVRAGSSYVTHLAALSTRLQGAGKSPIAVVEADRHLATEDILELVNAGVVALTVADRHIAEAWAQVLPNVVVRTDLEVHKGGRIAWAVRQSNPKLLADLNAFVGQVRAGSLLGNIFFRRYYRDSTWIKNPVAATERRKLEELIALFQTYADRYGFDWLAIAAQAYQESGLDQRKRSKAGAVGIMQLLPSTAAKPPIEISDIHRVADNIHAGVKYLRFLRDEYFSDPAIAAAARIDFTWAAYNAGPTRIARLRRDARRQGFDPNQWFGHVETIAAQQIGRETVEYVANINKYYVAYRLVADTLSAAPPKPSPAGGDARGD